MVASAIFITDLTGKPLISRNYRGDIPLTSAIEKFTNYLLEVEDDNKKPVFHVDSSGDYVTDSEDVGCTGVGGETFVYVQVRFVVCFVCCFVCCVVIWGLFGRGWGCAPRSNISYAVSAVVTVLDWFL